MTPGTCYQYSRMVTRFARYRVTHPDTSLTESVGAFLQSLTPASAHTAFLALRAALPDAAVPWATLRRPAARRNEAMLLGTLFDADEVRKVRAAATTPRERAIIELCWTLRRIETTRVRWADVNLTDGTIRLVRKGGKATWTLLPQSTQQALADWFVASGQPPDTAFILPGRFSRALHHETVSQLVRRLLKRAGVYRPGRGCHAWRRTLATRYLQANPGDLDGLAKLLGHSQVSTTFLYSFMQPATLRPRLDRVPL